MAGSVMGNLFANEIRAYTVMRKLITEKYILLLVEQERVQHISQPLLKKDDYYIAV